jgi:hypothetical protein
MESSENGGRRFLRNAGKGLLRDTRHIPDVLKMENEDLSEMLVNNYMCSRRHILEAVKMEAADFFETLVNMYLCRRSHVLDILKMETSG